VPVNGTIQKAKAKKMRNLMSKNPVLRTNNHCRDETIIVHRQVILASVFRTFVPHDEMKEGS